MPTGAVQVVTYEQQVGPKTGSQEAAALANQVVSSVDQLLQAALQQRASDIHLEPTREGLKIRFRIDGVLEQFAILPPHMQESILSRIKIMGSMDVAEHRISQDGRTRLRIGEREFDIRIATYPTLYGEAAAIRILSKEDVISLDSLGFSPKDHATFEKMIHKPHGIILVTGPTGSGKTTTLYTALQNIDRNKSHVLSVEDPIENEIDGVDQTQINTRAGVTFATALRAMLRQDPDVIMVGEIRDRETAEISLGAAMTGHLVLSTLHTNTAIGAIARLHDLGIETYLISATLLGVIAQRLVRRVCQSCKEEVVVPRELIMALGPKAVNVKTYHGKGCSECDNRGFKGRIGLYEFVEIDEEFRVLINNHAPDVRLREKAAMSGFHSILEDGIDKINQGLTTIEEVIRVCGTE
jgi:type II secretory ATPase GspE/PulE/Tfp pilus assembly ATPase PilB-like protein